MTANIQRVERGGGETRTGGDAICAAHSGRAASERGGGAGAGRRQPERVLLLLEYSSSTYYWSSGRARACRCCCRPISAWRRVWRSCSAAPRQVRSVPVPCAFMLRHGKKATFPRRAGTRTLSGCGAPCSGAWTVVCGQGYRGIGLRTGRWSRVAFCQSCGTYTPLYSYAVCVNACAQHPSSGGLDWLALGRIGSSAQSTCLSLRVPLPPSSSRFLCSTWKQERNRKCFLPYTYTVWNFSACRFWFHFPVRQ